MNESSYIMASPEEITKEKETDMEQDNKNSMQTLLETITKKLMELDRRLSKLEEDTSQSTEDRGSESTEMSDDDAVAFLLTSNSPQDDRDAAAVDQLLGRK